MNTALSKFVTLLTGIVVGSVATYVVFSPSQPGAEMKLAADEPARPKYWVAPMDPNYRRDKPGKSPMGMDLIAVYEDAMTASDAAGTIRISPAVVNNLGVKTREAVFEVWHSDISTVGYVQYDADKLVHIHPRVEGWIETLHVTAEGDPVEQGQALYEIYSPALVNAQNELLLALDRKNKKLITAARDRLQALQLPLDAIKNLEKTRVVQQAVTFYAPQQGVVDNLNVRTGFYVQPGTRIMSIGSLSEVWIEAEVFERQLPLLTEGAPVEMTLDYLPGKVWSGKVDYIYPSLDEKTRTVKVRLRFANEDRRLRPNMFAQISIASESSGKTLIVPSDAVIRTGKVDRVVMALGEGRFRSVEVSIGRVSGTSTEILSGLGVGDTVVTSAQFLLDSESSKSADFERMDYESAKHGEAMEMNHD
ncbi:MAG: efflux RND transporter periplasmic adaptor subunit [Proteobacteria bacterium]|nr:efflux RND transporter periplasmic adaptor subunit [Pseudomonadota bacterium]